MGHAAYMRGSRLISAQHCRDRGCAGCIYCRPEGPKPTPRPPGWGSKARERASACAARIVARAAEYDLPRPTIESLALAVEQSARVGAATALEAARAAVD